MGSPPEKSFKVNGSHGSLRFSLLHLANARVLLGMALQYSSCSFLECAAVRLTYIFTHFAQCILWYAGTHSMHSPFYFLWLEIICILTFTFPTNSNFFSGPTSALTV